MKKSVADSTLMALWRKAVLITWDYCDPLWPVLHKGEKYQDKTGESLQCHHVIPRKHFCTRWSTRNGVPLTVESHAYAHTRAGENALWQLVDWKWLAAREKMLKPDFLRHYGLTENEYRKMARDHLREIIKGADG